VIITTTDPITGEEIRNPQFKPYVIEGSGHLAVKIHFESEETRRQYLDRTGVEPPTDSYRAKIARAHNRQSRAADSGSADPLSSAADGGLSGAVS
jgi:hypothetical protein